MKRTVKEFRTNWVTTISGVILLVATVLVGFGVITQEESTEVVNQANNVVSAIFTIISAVSSLILIFKAKDE